MARQVKLLSAFFILFASLLKIIFKKPLAPIDDSGHAGALLQALKRCNVLLAGHMESHSDVSSKLLSVYAQLNKDVLQYQHVTHDSHVNK